MNSKAYAKLKARALFCALLCGYTLNLNGVDVLDLTIFIGRKKHIYHLMKNSMKNLKMSMFIET